MTIDKIVERCINAALTSRDYNRLSLIQTRLDAGVFLDDDEIFVKEYFEQYVVGSKDDRRFYSEYYADE